MSRKKDLLRKQVKESLELIANKYDELINSGTDKFKYLDDVELDIVMARGDANATETVKSIMATRELGPRWDQPKKGLELCHKYGIVGSELYNFFEFSCNRNTEIMYCILEMFEQEVFSLEDIIRGLRASSYIKFFDKDDPKFDKIIHRSMDKFNNDWKFEFRGNEWAEFCIRNKERFNNNIDAAEAEEREAEERYRQHKLRSASLQAIIDNSEEFMDRIDAGDDFLIISPTIQNVYTNTSTSELNKSRDYEYTDFGSRYYRGVLGDSVYYQDIIQRWDPDYGWDDNYMISSSLTSGNSRFNYDEENDVFHVDIDGVDCAIVAAVKGATNEQLGLIQEKLSGDIDNEGQMQWVKGNFVMKDNDMCGGPYSSNGYVYYDDVKSDYILVMKNWKDLKKTDTMTESRSHGSK